MTQERIFLTHPDGTEEIYNLQMVRESELPGFFSQFKLETDDKWRDVARRWLFFNASHLTEERVTEIVETHNEDRERILDHLDFNSYTQVVNPVRQTDGESITVEKSGEHGLIEYTAKNAEAFIGFTKIERNDPVVSFWKGGFYQGSLNTKTRRLFYGNDEVDFSIEVSEEFVEKVLSEVDIQ